MSEEQTTESEPTRGSYGEMLKRHNKGKYDADFFPTPPWVTRALIEFLHSRNVGIGSVWEPACGQGDMVRTLQELLPESQILMSDLHATDYGLDVQFEYDFINPENPVADDLADWVISNPPFGYTSYPVEGKKTGKRIYRPNQFALSSIRAARHGVAMLVRTNQLAGHDRYTDIYKPFAPTYFAQFPMRLNFEKGRLKKDASGMVDFGWMIWLNREVYNGIANMPVAGTELVWLDEGVRERHERDEDYPPPTAEDLAEIEAKKAKRKAAAEKRKAKRQAAEAAKAQGDE